MLIRFVEFSLLFAASVAGAILYFSPQTNPRWRPVLKYLMFALALALTLSEFLLKDFTGKGWEDRAAHVVGYTVCAVIPQFSRCYDRTIAELGEAIREDPRNAAILVARGDAYFGHGDFDRAIEDFDEAIRLNPELAVAYARRAFAYRAKGNDDRAVSDIQQANKLDSQYARVARAIEEETARKKIAAAPTPAAPFASAKSQPPQHDAAEIAFMMKSGAEFMVNGDIASARISFQHAAEAGEAVGAFALAETYDPVVLRQLNAKWGITPDVVLAQSWYEKAKELGSANAPKRLERLAGLPAATATPVSVSPPATPSVATRDREEIAALLARARTYLSAGDVAAARLVLRQAAERDNPQAALALAGTYDPTVLKRLGIVNFQADTALAREWYRRAAELGSADASLRLEQLIQTEAKSEPLTPRRDRRKSNAP